MVFINQSIVLISLPDIFRGIQLNPLTPGNTGYLLWMLMGFSVVLAVLVVTLGRVGDIFGRVKIFNLGFIVFTAFSLLLAVTWLTGHAGRPLAHRHARRPGRRRGHALRQLLGHHHRRLPFRSARPRSGHQQHRGHRRLVRRARPRRRAGPRRVAPRVPDLGARRHPRHHRRLRQAQGERGAHAGQDRLARERHLRRRPHPRPDRDHLRAAALRRALHGLDQPEGAGRDLRRHSPCWSSSASWRPG